mgnify:CR=1 FL=1
MGLDVEMVVLDVLGTMVDQRTGIARGLRRLRPDLVSQVRLGWGSVDFRHPGAGFVCAVFPMVDHVSLVFEHGRQLDNASGLLQGNGKQVRFIPFPPGAEIPEQALGLLLAEAIALRA